MVALVGAMRRITDEGPRWVDFQGNKTHIHPLESLDLTCVDSGSIDASEVQGKDALAEGNEPKKTAARGSLVPSKLHISSLCQHPIARSRTKRGYIWLSLFD